MKQRLTPLRQEIAGYIEASETPVSIKSIAASFHERCNLSTVYRGLDFLEEHEIVRSLNIAGTRHYYSPEKNGHAHFLICKNCREILSFETCSIGEMQATLEKELGYTITHHMVSFEGYCRKCYKSIQKKVKNR
jgi:Fur family transcriptional regulator, ferric uptake regulator